MTAVKVILEGLGLGLLLCLICAFGIRKGAVGMVFLYSEEVQERAAELGLTSKDTIRRRGTVFRCICLPAYFLYVLVSVYRINGTRGFVKGFIQIFIILSVMNLVDRFLIDDYWVGHTACWDIPGTEDLKPYITAEDKKKKWIMGTAGMAVISAVLAGIMSLILK